MVGDDANVVFIEVLKQILEIFRNMSYERGNKAQMKKVKAPKKPKIKFGKLPKADFEKMSKEGVTFNYVTVPKDKIPEIEKTARKLGGSFFATQIADGNNAVLAVPSQHLDVVNVAIKHAIGEIMKDDPDALVIKDGNAKISAEDMKLTADVLNSHDIPVYSFKSADGSYINVVPKDFEGQYEAAMKEAEELKKELENIEITKFEQENPLDELEYIAVEMKVEEAAELYAAAKANGLDVDIVKHGEGAIAKYSKDIAEAVDKARKEYQDSVNESEKYVIDVTDDTVTMDMATLLVGEDNSSYFVKVPNTGGLDYLILDKKDVEVINDGKTLSLKLDINKEYQIFNEDGYLKAARNGADLAKSYNTKHLKADKDTSIISHGDAFRRIDLYNKEQNRLISVGIDSADVIRAQLIMSGISPKAAENLLRDIDKKLPDEYKQTFSYTAEKEDIVYADIPNIGIYLAQSQLSEKVIGKAECLDEAPAKNGTNFCIYDKSDNSYTIMSAMPREQVLAHLTEIGFSEIAAKEIADKVIGTYTPEDMKKFNETVEQRADLTAQSFDSRNPEISNLSYYNTKDSTLIVQDNGDSFRYIDVDKGTPPADVEKALMTDFEIKDVISAAEVMKQLANDGTIESPAPIAIGDVTVRQLSASCVEISLGDKSAIMARDNIDTSRLEEMGIPEKEINLIGSSFSKAAEEAKNPKKQTFRDIRKKAGEMRYKINREKEKTAGKIATSPVKADTPAKKGQEI